MNNKCPKCNQKLKPTYMKQNCPNCGINLLYYKLDERLELDAQKAEKEVNAVKRFLNILKTSSISSPWLIVRLVLFFTPLASMCLPMFWAGHKNVSLITFIMSIINHGFDLTAIASDKSYLFAVLSIVFIIVLSLVEIINSLFSTTKKGFRRNIIFSGVNTFVFALLTFLVWQTGGKVKIGVLVTFIIYGLEFLLHFVTAKPKKHSRKAISIISAVLCVALGIVFLVVPAKADNQNSAIAPTTSTANVGVVSFNVASAFGTSLEDTDSMTRCARFSSYMQSVAPDFIGTQEMNEYWLDELTSSLSNYENYGVLRGGDSEKNNSEMNPIFWLKDKYTAIEKNTFWLSETPDEESKYTYVDEDGEQAEAGCNRICSYAVLKNNDDAQIYILMNTHLDNASEQARVFGISVIIDKINSLRDEYGSDVNIVLTGDFNEVAGDTAYTVATSVLNDSNVGNNNCATYQDWGYTSTGDMPIDFIFSSGSGENYTVLNNIDNGYVSDHYGIYSQIKF
jgi:endonuclease/exonuclease/phosphatase family metal-dependent hydrolase